MFDLTGKVIVITGASRGLGKAMADALRDQGARIVNVCRSGKGDPDDLNVMADLSLPTARRQPLGRSSRRRILPTGDFGRLVRNSMYFGSL